MRTQAAGSNVTEAPELQLTVLDPTTNATVCTVTNGIKQALVTSHIIDLSGCVDGSGESLLTANDYLIEVIDPTVPSKDLFYNYSNSNYNELSDVEITRSDATGSWSPVAASSSQGYSHSHKWQNNTQAQQALYVLFALNPNISTSGFGQNPQNDDSTAGSQCEQSASPLVIDMTPMGLADPGPQLSAPKKGVKFDILGANAPVPYSKTQISWVLNPNYMFLTLPNAGQISGIDQLFGNNTKGPDGQFAANGFLALAKYDLNGDGVIDAKDAIFSDLRLWSDLNHDGIAQADELHSLASLGVSSINLNYNASFFEQDQYGNQIRYKSTGSSLQGLRGIFDIWFVLP